MAVSSDRDVNVTAFRKTLEPIRAVLAAQPYLGGEMPTYADYVVFGCFQWARCISAFSLLLKDDPVWAWRDRSVAEGSGIAEGSVNRHLCLDQWETNDVIERATRRIPRRHGADDMADLLKSGNARFSMGLGDPSFFG
jgi:glutathione S-transferase